MNLRRAATAAAVLVVATALAAPSAALAAGPDLTWTGAAVNGTWSTSSNWDAAAPATNESLGTLTFPQLTGACALLANNDPCYDPNNDVTGLSVDGLLDTATTAYSLDGDGIDLGAGGVTSAAEDFSLKLPVTLTAPQTWTFSSDGFISVSDLTGSGALTLSGFGSLFVGDTINVGPVTVTNETALDLNGTGASVNVTDASPVTLKSGGDLRLFGDTASSAITSEGGALTFGVGMLGNGALSVTGGVTLDAASNVSMTFSGAGSAGAPVPNADFSQLTATGPVNLGGASLTLAHNVDSGGTCDVIPGGTVFPLIKTTGALTGTFAGLPNNSPVPIGYTCSTGTLIEAAINYTAHGVTATTVEAKPAKATSPTIPGTPTATSKLTAKPGAWTQSPYAYGYQWLLCPASGACKAIPNATASTYTPTTAQLGEKFEVKVTAVNDFGTASSTSAKSKATQPTTKAIKTSLQKLITSLRSKKLLTRLLSKHSVQLSFKAPSAGTLKLTLFVSGKKFTVIYANADGSSRHAGQIKARLKLTHTARTDIKSLRHKRVSSLATFTPKGGKPTGVGGHVTL